jgi:HSP20-like domain found in ArsA
VIALPSAMQRCRVEGARLHDGWLRIRFRHEREAAADSVGAGAEAR